MTCSRSGWLWCCRGSKTWTPSQPQGADEHKNLEGCCGWVLTWPKTQIRLVKEQQVTQPPRMPPARRPQPAVAATTSRHQQLLAARFIAAATTTTTTWQGRRYTATA